MTVLRSNNPNLMKKGIDKILGRKKKKIMPKLKGKKKSKVRNK